MQYEVFVLASISCKEGVACGVQFCMKSLFWRQSVAKEGVSSIQYFLRSAISISCKEGVACGAVLYEVFVLASISFKEGVSSVQYFIAIQCNMKFLFWRQSVVRRVCLCSGVNSCKEGVSSIQYFIAIQCNMKSLFWRQSVVRRVCLAFNTLSQYSAI